MLLLSFFGESEDACLGLENIHRRSVGGERLEEYTINSFIGSQCDLS